MTKRQRWSALGLLSAGLLIVVMDMTILMVALPNLIADIQPTAVQQLWIVDVYSLIMAGLLIPMSALADRFGRRKALLCGFALFGAISALVLVASTPEFVIVLRGLLGVGGAMIMPTTLSMVRSIFTDPAERTRALAIWSVVAGVGAILGPVVGGGLLEVFSWRAAFLVNVPVAVIVVCAGLIVLPESRDPKPAKWDVLSVVLSIASAIIMSSTPAARAGNAAASEESMYEIGNVLGVAILGSIAASLYRSGLDTGGLPEVPAGLAKESLVNALVIADELNLPRLSTSATTAFNDGLAVAALTGGVITMLAAVLVFVLVPRGFDVNTDAGH